MAKGGCSRSRLPRFGLKRWLLVAFFVVGAFGGHFWYWYLPRERFADFEPESAVGRLFDGEYSYRLWIPFPHQNLSTLSNELSEQWLGATARLLGTSSWSMPRFGPFRFPPSRSLVVASDAGGERGAIAVDVYPAIAVVARLAGRVAGNPALSGGTIESAGGSLSVEWLGNTWLITRGELADPNPDHDVSSIEVPAALAWLVVRDLDGPLPPGRYRASHESGSFVLSSFAPEPSSSSLSAPLFEALPPDLVGELAFLSVVDAGGRDANVLLLARKEDDALRLPDAAVLFLDEADRSSLPGESLARMLDIDLRRATVGRWGIMALSDRGLEVALALGEALDSALPPELSELLWVRPSMVLPLVEATRRVVETVPLVGREELQYWSDLIVVLEPLLKSDVVLLEVGTDGSVAVRFEGTG